MTEDDANILRQGKLENDSYIIGLFQNQLVSYLNFTMSKKLKKFNKDMQKWLPFLKYEKVYGDSNKNSFFNSWFLDLEQLMLIVQESNSNEELLARLRDTKCVTMGSYNFYRERRMAREMNSNKG